MSEKIDSLMNVIAQCRASSVADRMMIEALFCTHASPVLVQDAWNRLHSANVFDRIAGDKADNFERAVNLELEEAFSHWSACLSVAVAKGS